MPQVRSARKSYIVSLDTMLGWKRFERENSYSEILEQIDGGLLVQGGNNGHADAYTIKGKLIEKA